MHQPSITTIRIADFGSLELSIPILAYGSGRPIVTLVTGIHGQETAGLFVVERFLATLGDFSGQVRVIPSANPVAQALALRTSPRDNLDLNRIFPGKDKGQLPERIAFHLMKVLSDSSLVIDFHSFGLLNRTFAIYANCGEAETREESLAFIKAFSPTMIWLLDLERSLDENYKGALAPALHAIGVPNFAVEMPSTHRLSQEDIDAAAEGIKRTLVRLEMCEGSLSPEEDVAMYRREDYYAPRSGLFFPDISIMTQVNVGQPLARIVSMTGFTETPVTAPRDGMLLQIHDRGLVTTGDAIFAMGRSV